MQNRRMPSEMGERRIGGRIGEVLIKRRSVAEVSRRKCMGDFRDLRNCL